MDFAIGQDIAGYSLESKVASGGMGSVWRARQKAPDRSVALKLLHADRQGDDAKRRFLAEGEFLARLQHPNICRVFEAGTSEIDGESVGFLAMELVEGRELVRYAQGEDLSRNDRLELFARVCEGVHHAHQRRVIHRDLKSSNVLVTTAGEPKVVDFGVAGELGRGPSEATRSGVLLGTLLTMSPEQLEGGEVDTRCDVHGLGALLYHLMTGSLPFGSEVESYSELVRTIRDTPAPRLGRARADCRGDIETICSKALEKEPQRRYASALDLAQDVRRSLRHEPITARPPSAFYHLKKLARRHRAAAWTFSFSLLILAFGAFVSSVRLVRTQRARESAEALRIVAEAAAREAVAAEQAEGEARRETEAAHIEAQRAEGLSRRIRGSLERMLTTAPRDSRVIDVLRAYEGGLASEFADAPEVELDLRRMISASYAALGLNQEASGQDRRLVELSTTSFGPTDERTLLLELQAAKLLSQGFRFAEAKPVYEDLLVRATEGLGAGAPVTLMIRRDLCEVRWMLSEDIKSVVTELEAILELQRELAEGSDMTLLRTRRLFGRVLFEAGEDERGEHELRESIAALEQSVGHEHPETWMARGDLAQILLWSERYEEAEELIVAEYEFVRVQLGGDHPRTLYTRGQLGTVLAAQGRREEALVEIEGVYARKRALFGEEDAQTLNTALNLGHLMLEMGRFERARELYETAAAGYERLYGKAHRQTVRALEGLRKLEAQ